MLIQDVKLAVIGLGYVGLPLAVEFAKKRSVLGFDIKPEHVLYDLKYILPAEQSDLRL